MEKIFENFKKEIEKEIEKNNKTKIEDTKTNHLSNISKNLEGIRDVLEIFVIFKLCENRELAEEIHKIDRLSPSLRKIIEKLRNDVFFNGPINRKSLTRVR